MKHLCRAISVALILCSPLLTASGGAGNGVIPADRQFPDAWQSAGYPGAIPSPALIVDVCDFGAVGDGITDDHPAVVAAVDALGGGPGVVFFPAGTYRMNASLNPPAGTVLRGERSSTACLLFEVAGHCINVSASQGESFQPLISGYTIFSSQIEVTDGSLFQAGDLAEIREDNDPAWHCSDWASHAVGQLVTITAVDGNMLNIESPLRITYRSDLFPEIRRIDPITEVGIENIKVERLLTGTPEERDNQCTIYFNYAARCWVRGVEGFNTFGGHVGTAYSTRISVTGCYLHHAHEYDGGGSGYGVRVQYKTGDCLVENNILRHLRHSMLIQVGVNGNVFGYNYSREPKRTEWPSELSSDITGHGNYSFANLFEGNICQHIWLDSSHGANGPLNTFFRNRAEDYGLNMTDTLADNQNFVGNETFRGTWWLFVGDGYSLKGSGHFEYGNNTEADGIEPDGTDDLADISYYLGSDPALPPPMPAFWNIPEMLPTVGPPCSLNPDKKIPARERYFAGSCFTVGPPSIARQPDDLLVDRDQTGTVETEAYGTPAADYSWERDGIALPDETNASLVISGAQWFHGGTYRARISDSWGEELSRRATVEVVLPGAATIILLQHDDGTTGYWTLDQNWKPETFTPIGDPTPGKTFQGLDGGWILTQDNGGGAVDLLDIASLGSVSVDDPQPGWIARALERGEILLQNGDGGQIRLLDLESSSYTQLSGAVPGWTARSLDEGQVLIQQGDGGQTWLWDVAGSTNTRLFGAMPGLIARDIEGDLVLVQFGDGGMVYIWDQTAGSASRVCGPIPGWRVVSLYIYPPLED